MPTNMFQERCFKASTRSLACMCALKPHSLTEFVIKRKNLTVISRISNLIHTNIHSLTKLSIPPLHQSESAIFNFLKSSHLMIEKAVNAVIRPPRMDYFDEDIPLILEADDDRTFIRYPVTFRNRRSETLVGSIYHAIDHPPFEGGPCVLYLHGNASSQLEGQFLVPNLCPHGIFVFCFDFAGCGCSGGKYVSLGWFEKEDTEFLLDVLQRTFRLGPFVLWGRSMGASTALLVKHPLLVGRVIDSAFTSVRDMCSAVAVSMKLPKVFVPAAMWFLKKKVLSAAKFDFDAVAPIQVDNAGCEVPAVFGHAEKDQFIPFEQCQRLYNHYQSPLKYLMILPGGHNSKRKIEWIQLGVFFCLEQFKINPENATISECRRLQESTFHFTSFADMVGQAPCGDVSQEEIRAVVEDEGTVERIMEEVEEEPKKRHRRRKHHRTGEEGGERRKHRRRHRKEKKEETEEEVEQLAGSEQMESAPATAEGDSAMTSQEIFDLDSGNSDSEEGKVGDQEEVTTGEKKEESVPQELGETHEEEKGENGNETVVVDEKKEDSLPQGSDETPGEKDSDPKEVAREESLPEKSEKAPEEETGEDAKEVVADGKKEESVPKELEKTREEETGEDAKEIAADDRKEESDVIHEEDTQEIQENEEIEKL